MLYASSFILPLCLYSDFLQNALPNNSDAAADLFPAIPWVDDIVISAYGQWAALYRPVPCIVRVVPRYLVHSLAITVIDLYGGTGVVLQAFYHPPVVLPIAVGAERIGDHRPVQHHQRQATAHRTTANARKFQPVN